MDPLSITAGIIAVLGVTLKVLDICYEYNNSFKNASKDLSKVIEEIISLRTVLETLQQLARKVENADPTAVSRLPSLRLLSEPQDGPLVKCLAVLEALKQKLNPPSLNGQAKSKRKALMDALSWPLKEEDTKTTLENIGRFKATLNLAIIADQTTMLVAIENLTSITKVTSCNMQKGVANLEMSFLSKSIDDIINKVHKWLSAPDSSSNYKKALDERHKGTGMWFIISKEFVDWKINRGSFLWLYGKPGSGKSILATTIIENVLDHCRHNPDRAVAFFYFDFADKEKQQHESMIRSLITQLSTQNTHLAQVLDSFYSSCNDGRIQPTLDALLVLFREVIEHFQQTFIVIDALDECIQRDRLLTVVEDIVGWKLARLHILITSRKENDIEESITSLTKAEERIGVQGSRVNDDIYAYVHSRIRTDRNLKRWQKQTDVQQEIEETLIRKADGMFRWVTCQLDSLKNCLNRPSLRKALTSLPKSLDETYDRILCNIDEDNRQYALRILQWLTLSARPMTTAELAEAVVVEIDEDPHFDPERRFPQPQDVLKICSSLITTATATEDIRKGHSRLVNFNVPEHTVIVVKLAHFSVKEYLVSNRITQGPAKQYSIQEVYANTCMAETCLAYLLHLGNPYCFYYYEDVDADEVDDPEWFPLARYAAHHWTHHARMADPETSIYPDLCMKLYEDKDEVFLLRVHKYDIYEIQHFLTMLVARDGFPLYYACVAGLLKPAKLLIDKGVNVNAQSENCGGALQAASLGGYEDVVQLLLDKGADVNAQGGEHFSALTAATKGDHESVVQLLLDKGADVNAQSGENTSALAIASRRGNENLVQLFVKKGADINNSGALRVASGWCQEKIVQFLLDQGADLNTSGALHAAAQNDDEKMIQYLLDNGAHINVPNHPDGGFKWDNALQPAVMFGRVNAARKLLHNGAEINTSGALSFASRNSKLSMVQFLLDHGADVNFQHGKYGNALQNASNRRHYDVVQYLLDKGADINGNACPEKFDSALQGASLGHEALVSLLLNYRADINISGALQPASLSGNQNIVQWLLDRGADVNTPDRHYGYAICCASSEGHSDIVQMLLDNGAQLNVQDEHHGSPLKAAIYHRKSKVATAKFKWSADRHYIKSNALTQLLLDNDVDMNVLDDETLKAAAFAFKFNECTESCMRIQLTSMFKRNVEPLNCDRCQKMTQALEHL